MSSKFKKRSAVKEPGAKDIPLPLSDENLKLLLANIVEGNSKYSHQDFAGWCSKHFGNIVVNDFELKDFGIYEATYEVLNDVDAQWDLYLVNEYKVDELKKVDLSKISLPKQWFQNWLNRLK